MKTFTATFRFVKETKNTLVYEATELSAIASVYVQKAALGGKQPKEVKITLEILE